jgi:DNA-binding response OmpR family regulator
LLVDGDEVCLRALENRLRAAGFEVASAADAHEGAELAVKLRPDLIILDADMPGYSGLELHECLQFSERAKNIPVLYLTASESDSARSHAFQQGARAFIAKPYVPGRLIKTITGLLGAA